MHTMHTIDDMRCSAEPVIHDGHTLHCQRSVLRIEIDWEQSQIRGWCGAHG